MNDDRCEPRLDGRGRKLEDALNGKWGKGGSNVLCHNSGFEGQMCFFRFFEKSRYRIRKPALPSGRHVTNGGQKAAVDLETVT